MSVASPADAEEVCSIPAGILAWNKAEPRRKVTAVSEVFGILLSSVSNHRPVTTRQIWHSFAPCLALGSIDGFARYLSPLRATWKRSTIQMSDMKPAANAKRPMRCEPLRILWRLVFLRESSHEQEGKQIF
ncbi:hypothetical protein, partial [Burkholderia orbicola]|uniref:hypothetical protein n=1 Tax=Burkholderia orbicola TaxID=2978683 RepID=UPI002FE0A9E6